MLYALHILYSGAPTPAVKYSDLSDGFPQYCELGTYIYNWVDMGATNGEIFAITLSLSPQTNWPHLDSFKK